MNEPVVYLNGRTVAASQAQLAIFDKGLVFGATVAEMTRTFGGRLFRLEDHLDRLFHSLNHVGFGIGMSRTDVMRVSEEVTAHNIRLLERGEELGLIHFVTAGEYASYAAMPGTSVRSSPTVCIHTFPLALSRFADRMRHGVRLITPTVRHVPPACYEPSIKYRSRLHMYLADEQARAADAEASALLLDLADNITETPAANFLIVEQGGLVSPTRANILPGVSRQTVIELATDLGIPFTESDIPLDRALRADEAIITGTPYCLLPVAQINGEPIGTGVPGPLFERLLGAFSARVGLDIRAQIQSTAAEK